MAKRESQSVELEGPPSVGDSTGIGVDVLEASLDKRWQGLGVAMSESRTLLCPEVLRGLLDEWNEICRQENDLDDRLVIGLIGGTGVGKSTLINALAGEVISTPSDRRPTTDRIVVYRHKETPLPSSLNRADFPHPEVTHENRGLERILLLDFPDFDSVMKLHHEIFRAFAPSLDLLLLVVDDVKYADARLYELVGHLPQNPENFHPVLNKIDRLQLRYPEEWREVSRSILEDLRNKLAIHSNVRVDPGRFLALSARNAFERKLSMDSDANLSSEDDVGAFGQLVEALTSYRREKRRRAAKELNLEARKAAFVAQLKESSLAPEVAVRVEAALQLARDRALEVDRSFHRIPEAILTYEERRAIADNLLRRGTSYVRAPIDTLWTLFGELRRRRRRQARAIDLATVLTDPRIRQHYRAHFEGIENHRREVQLAIGDTLSLREAERAGAASESFEAVRHDFQARLTRCEDRLRKRFRLWNHLLPVAVLVGSIWSLAHPVVDATLKRTAGEEGSSWTTVAKEVLYAFFGALNPTFIIGTLAAVALSYGITAMVTWLRQSQRIETAVCSTERQLRERARIRGNEAMGAAREQLEEWLRQRGTLVACVRDFEKS